MVPERCDNQKEPLSWEQLVARDSRLAWLEEDCRSYRGGRRLDYWYARVKPVLVGLVGYTRRRVDVDEVLGSSAAYDVAYDHLLATLMARRPRRAGVERRGWAA